MQALSDALQDFLVHLERHGLRYDFDAAMVHGGAAFRHYFFTPEDNHAWLVEYPGEHWREDSLNMDSYGVFEAIQGHTGWSARQWRGLKGAELVTLLQHEQKDGRLIRVLGTDGARPGLIESFDASREGLTLRLSDGPDAWELQHAGLATLDDFVPSLGVLQTLRKEPSEIPTRRRHALTEDALRWAVRHWESRKEIRFDLEAYYATGARAWRLLADFAERALAGDADFDADAARAYIARHLGELARARRSAERFFADPAMVLEHTGRAALAAPQLELLRERWATAADAAESASSAGPGALVDAIDQAHTRDEEAIAALRYFVQ